MIDHLTLLERLRYEPDEGVFYWKCSPRNGVNVGDVAGCDHGDGYKILGLGGRTYLCHRLAWFYMNGEWPPRYHDIDHINGNRSDNRIKNLRLATRSQNVSNSVSTRSESGIRGVHWNSRGKRWIAKITIRGKTVEIGHFKDKEAAAAAYREYSLLHNSEFSGARCQEARA